jgi:hypothetical protein
VKVAEHIREATMAERILANTSSKLPSCHLIMDFFSHKKY